MEKLPSWIDELEARIAETQASVDHTLRQIDEAMRRVDMDILDKENLIMEKIAERDAIIVEIENVKHKMEMNNNGNA